MFRAIADKSLPYDLLYRSNLSLNKSTISGSLFLNNGFMLKCKSLVKMIDMTWSNNYLQLHIISL